MNLFIVAPKYPEWDNNTTDMRNDGYECTESEIGQNDGECSSSNFSKRGLKRQRIEDTKLNAQFAESNLLGVETCQDFEEITRIRSEMQRMCNWNG